VLERSSNLVCGRDFGVGYSPERVNPGDKEHTLINIPKIISAINQPTLNVIAEVYQSIVKAGVFRVSSMRVAEAAKVMENIQRDVNISFINEMALILHRLGMDSREVLDAMQTKWNALPFQPGLVGGHCIAVNSYYVVQRAEEAGFYPDVIVTSRRVNEYMPRFIAESAVKELIHLGIPVKNARIAVLGLTYKENTPDVHDTKTLDLINELKAFELDVLVHDPLADPVLTKAKFNVELVPWENIGRVDAIILTLAHKKYLQLAPEELQAMLNRPGLIMDIKGMLKPEAFTDKEITVWRL
jgi:UDP-N-acetyl-D-galactosamine dehydrogenase